MKELGVYAGMALAIVGIGFLFGVGGTQVHLIVIPLLLVLVSYLIGRMMATENDASFIAPMFALGAVAKMLGSTVRHWVLFAQYGGVGDAVGYHNRGLELAEVWRSGAIPAIPEGMTSLGTRFTAWATGVVYAPFGPSMQGGFYLFAGLALFGQFLFYAAYRRWAPPRTHFRYLALILFWPTLVYWPSSLGKEALLMPFIALGAYAASRVFQTFGFPSLLVFGIGAGVVFIVREHVTALLALSLLGTIVAAKPRAGVAGRRLLLVLLMMGALVPVAGGLSDRFGVQFQADVSAEDFDGIRADLERSTGQGGSAVSGGVVSGPQDLPAGFLKVLYRPLPNEATNTQMLIASFEGTLLLLLTLWTLPRWLPTLKNMRREPYLMFCAVYTLGFVIAWSWILNLGILARQRSLVIPFILVIFAYGWYDRRANPPEATDEPARYDDLIALTPR
jgi:hypothetical protein